MNPIAQAAVKAITKLRPNIQDGYLRQRAAEDASARLTIASPRCRIDDKVVATSEGAEIPIRVFTPLDIDFYTDTCMKMALKLNRRVVSVDYRRSPEHKFPAALVDCYEVARQLFARELLDDVDPEHIVLFGDSAGGNLAASVSLLARELGEFTPRTQILLYPLVYNDHTLTSMFDSVRENGEDYILTREDINGYVDLYLSSPADFFNPYFAPLLEEDLSHQPRTLVVTAEYCPLRDEGETYAARLELEGNEVECVRVLNAIHGYFLYPSVFGFVRDTYKIIESFLDHQPLPQEDDATWLALLGTD